MIHLVIGGQGALEKARQIGENEAKKLGKYLFVIDSLDVQISDLMHFLESDSLFTNDRYLLLKRPSKNRDILNYLLSDDFANNFHITIWMDTETDSSEGIRAIIKKLGKAGTVHMFTDSKNNDDKIKRNLLYSATENWIKSNPIHALYQFQHAKKIGISAEEFLRILMWQVKTILLVNDMRGDHREKLEKQSGLHPYVIEKSRKLAKYREAANFRHVLYNLSQIELKARKKSIPTETFVIEFILSN